MREVRPVGTAYLGLVTDLLQRGRLADPHAGLWEAADLQWWYRCDQHATGEDAVVWTDTRTSVGLVEPMRVEDEHSGRGIGGALLRFGLDRLAARGCRRLKVSHDIRNKAAGRVYLGAGFEAQMRVPTYLRPATQ